MAVAGDTIYRICHNRNRIWSVWFLCPQTSAVSVCDFIGSQYI